jgi:TPR repeat protein
MPADGFADYNDYNKANSGFGGDRRRQPFWKGVMGLGRALLAILIAFMLAAAAPEAPRAQTGGGDQWLIGKRAYEARNFKAAFRLLKPLAEAGNAEAQFMVGNMYNLGAGAPRDNAAAIEWYRKSAMQDNFEAIEMLGQGMRLLGESTN